MKTQTVVVLVTLLVACVRIQTGRNNFVGGRDVAIITIWGGSYYLLHHHTIYMYQYSVALHLSQTRLTLTR